MVVTGWHLQQNLRQIMHQQTKDKLPQWYLDKSPKNLILSNDIDSLLSVKLLERVNPEWKLKYFYDFDSGLYYIGDGKGKKSETVGVDIALDIYDLMTFDNHVTSDDGNNINPNSINLNNICGINSSNYSRKYCGSTALLIYSLYDIPLPKTDMGKALLLAIDSTYISYYNPIEKNRPEWLEIHKHWICDILGFPELYELEKKHTKADFDKFSYVNKAEIQVIDDMNDGNYTMYYDLRYKDDVEECLGIPLDIPYEQFRLIRSVKAKQQFLDGKHKGDIAEGKRLMSFAMTGKNHCNYSVIV